MDVYLGVKYYDVCLSQKIVFILATSADPDEMQHYAAFHLGLHYLPKYPFGGFQYRKGQCMRKLNMYLIHMINMYILGKKNL